jgi:hypothetical protein
METRSMTKEKNMDFIPIYDVIDFDDASKCWRENKKHIGNGQFQYICGATKTNGNLCIRKRKNGFTRCVGHCKGEQLDSDWLRIKGR